MKESRRKELSNNISIGENEVYRLRALAEVENLRTFVDGESDLFFRHIPALNTGTRRVGIRELYTGIKGFKYGLKFKRLAKKDKIEFFIHNEIYFSGNKGFAQRFYPDDAPSSFSPEKIRELSLFRFRMKFLVALAFTSVISGSEARFYAHNQRKESRLMRIKHEEIYPYIKEYTNFTGDFAKDFKKAMNVLWYNYPVDITGFDDKIKRISLEENMNNN